MYPTLSTRRRLLLALLILGGKSRYSTIKSFLPSGYAGPKFYGMLKRLEKDGLIRRNPPLVRLLPAGIELLESRYGPRIHQLLIPDIGYRRSAGRTVGRSDNPTIRNPKSEIIDWSLIILNFPTDQAYWRSRLVGRLLELGYGSLRDGVYVSPYPVLSSVAEWAEENDCLERVTLATINHQQSTVNNFLKGWDLSALSRRYLSFVDRLTIAKGISLPQKRHRAIARIKSDFLDLLIRDPLLPKSLLPADYPLARVLKVIAGPDPGSGLLAIPY